MRFRQKTQFPVLKAEKITIYAQLHVHISTKCWPHIIKKIILNNPVRDTWYLALNVGVIRSSGTSLPFAAAADVLSCRMHELAQWLYLHSEICVGFLVPNFLGNRYPIYSGDAPWHPNKWGFCNSWITDTQHFRECTYPKKLGIRYPIVLGENTQLVVKTSFS